ncbi:MAG: class I mannose-6-phosphate isomerase [Firmicutes bacterium]|nr:class I mannose-6-phosphate isomerase [Bacillota bacterium]
MKHKLYPLTFHPIYKEKIWGGRRLQDLFGRALPEGLIGESWDVAAHVHGTSVVDHGPLAGKNLVQLALDYGEELLGKGVQAYQGKFPLLLKLIDANQDLSVQVHPHDAYVRDHTNEMWGKTELWYIVHSEPGAWIVWGLRPGTTKEEFAQAIKAGGDAILACLNKVPVQAGEVYPISAGLVHALGAGCLVAEIQQNSDTTYRVYDWDRLDETGQARELHVKQALEVIDFSPLALDRDYQFSRCGEYFELEVLEETQGVDLDVQDGFQILTNVKGNAEVIYQGNATKIVPGQSCLLPAALQTCQLYAEGVVLKSSPSKAGVTVTRL